MPTHLTKLLSVLNENGIIHDESFAIERRFEIYQKEPVGELIVKKSFRRTGLPPTVRSSDWWPAVARRSSRSNSDTKPPTAATAGSNPSPAPIPAGDGHYTVNTSKTSISSTERTADLSPAGRTAISSILTRSMRKSIAHSSSSMSSSTLPARSRWW